MEMHTNAINAFMLPLLLSIIGVLLGIIAWNLRQTLARNEREHGELFEAVHEHDRRLDKTEIRLVNLERN